MLTVKAAPARAGYAATRARGLERKRVKLIGITGGMCSGKSTVARMFRDLGAGVIDADKIAKALLLETDVKKRIISIFGREILSRNIIDRRKLAGRVFKRRSLLRKLCDIVHPAVITRIEETASMKRRRIVIVDAPLLIESGLHRRMDKVIVVTAKLSAQLARCGKRGFGENDVKSRLREQIPASDRLKYSDFIIDNSGTLGKTKIQVERVWNRLQ